MDSAMASGTEARMLHPFAFGACLSIILGTITLLLEEQNMNSFQTPYAAQIVPILVFGYFPITLVLLPVAMAIIGRIWYGNTKGIWWYFGGSAIFGFIYSIPIWALLIIGVVLGGTP